MRKLALAVLAVVLGSFALAGCSSSSDPGQKTDSKHLMVYTPASEELINLIVPAFEEETGIQVEIVAASTGELLTRIKGEAENPIADVMWGGSPSLIMPLKEYFEEYVSVNDQYLSPEFKNKEGFVTRYSSTSPVLLINTDLIGDIEVNGYADLLKPELKGKIAHGDSATSSSSFNHLENMLFAMGKDKDPFSQEAWDYVEAFVNNLDGKVVSSSGNVHKGVADGEYYVGLTYEEPAVTYLQDGAPVKVVYMEEGTIFKESGNYIVKNAKNLENAKLFSDFLLSEQVQNLLGLETMNRPVRADAELASFKTPISEIKTIEYDVLWGLENKDAIVEKYMDVVTK
ncbi:ABC transporter substrate-binding protein [Paenibacillus sp. J2TS4]|uniref:ABC transporter substrate-binding protein n=1 Tax=Paenibacillus sp. J2TS4 TaxID=2807194 RepID=UPI001AFE249C|nr:ABC transporter substrate-binding protein [Paenibacillus sp. J2TS4]GIP36505.1 iron(III)-binding protein [Paenibacillus sp. J2TS4]